MMRPLCSRGFAQMGDDHKRIPPNITSGVWRVEHGEATVPQHMEWRCEEIVCFPWSSTRTISSHTGTRKRSSIKPCALPFPHFGQGSMGIVVL